MNFDFGELLTRAGQITWKHKILWLFSALPTLLSFAFFPVVFLPILLTDFDPYGEPFFVKQPVYIVLFIGFSIVISLLSILLYAVSSASVTLGAVQAEDGAETLRMRKLFEDGRKYWLRVIGVVLLFSLGVWIVMMALFGCMALFGAVTMGIGFICLQPLFLLTFPLMLVLYGIIEESLAAVVVDDLIVTDAIRRGWELIRANFWRILLISLVAYLGVGVLSAVVIMPFMAPFFFMPFLMQDPSGFDPRTMMLFMGGFMLLLLPVMALVQGVTITFLKATYALVYLRLTRPREDAPIPVEANA
ncbi:MAG: hypothetical protein L6Q26_03825 [Anaerolineales bacterium]|nr:hypothetical protein [Anaerolineales bacterium]NUQ83934.1 hypothetical protein [Anaerolineales bacterium]